MSFDHDGPGLRNGAFGGLPTTPDEAEVILVPAPWDVTVSSHDGTRRGPRAILEESPQLEFLDPFTNTPWSSLAMLPIDAAAEENAEELRRRATSYIDWIEAGSPRHQAASMQSLLTELNAACAANNEAIERACGAWLDRGGVVGVVGGDHSTPLGLYRALRARGNEFGILHIDAHCDLRRAYEGFQYSHASIMRNVCEERLCDKLVQVATRDFCAAERDFIADSNGFIQPFTDRTITRQLAEGITWARIVRGIVETLPQNIVISFDIDGLQAWQCPHTGTPVPGGLEFEQCFQLFEAVVRSGRRIIGFDVVEVAPARDGGGIDAVFGARAVYRLAALAALGSHRP
jgi:agmatinase